ncbi:MAG TPA: 50S ribosomal protein L15 [Gammaproteobacteria bacterium]|nr:50S ribosomal protein L15 [Candidatus Hydrogenedentota bacterium]HJP34670.1 50S ribosomal protein L15 [Gammaproteobacteria bacterium]
MDLSDLTYAPGTRRPRKRVGRGPGSGTGKTSGRGQKGQKSRSGTPRRPGFEGGQTPLARRFPKRGFHHADRYPAAEINVDILNEAFNDDDEVTEAILIEKGLVKKREGGVKVLGRGELTKKLVLTVHGATGSARAKVEGAGGSISFIEAPPARALKTPKKSAEA